jgi:uncharacterized protein YjbJ (UPF0337 family)
MHCAASEPAIPGAGLNRDSDPQKPKEEPLNKDILEGQWKQMRGKARAWWGKLTDDDFKRIAGKFESLTGTLQEKYGYTRQQAESEIDKRVTAYNTGLSKDKTVPRH